MWEKKYFLFCVKQTSKSLLYCVFEQFLQEVREVGVALRQAELVSHLAAILVVTAKVGVCLHLFALHAYSIQAAEGTKLS